jgi:hypothetical protein
MPIFELIVPIVDILPQEGNNGACDKAVPTIDFLMPLDHPTFELHQA